MSEGNTGWRTASRCDGGACVEVAASPGGTAVRDKADREGTVLTIPAAAWRTFTSGVRSGAA